MADHVVPHFHNDPGVPVIEIGAKRFMCVGARPPFDHPHIFCDMGDETEIICSYCSTLFRYDPALDPHAARPAECGLGELVGEAARAGLGHDRIEVAIQLPVLELIHFLEQRFFIKSLVKILLQFVRVEAVGKLLVGTDHGFKNGVMMKLKITADFANGINRTEVFTFFANE